MRERHPQHARVGVCRNSRCLKPSEAGATAPTRVDSHAALPRDERTDMTRRWSFSRPPSAAARLRRFTHAHDRALGACGASVLFECNDGQAAGTYRFVARGPAFEPGFTAHGVVLATNDRHVAFDFVGAAEAVVPGDAPLAAYVNHLRRRNASQWQTHVPTYACVRYTHLYDRADAVFYVAGPSLEYDLTIGPHGDRARSRCASAADRVAIDGDGN